jgi:hypothetical protein
MGKSILSKEINSMKYLLGYKRGVVISEQQAQTFGNPNQFSTNPFAPKTQATNTQTTSDIYNEFQRQQGPAAQGFKDFQAKYGQQAATPAPATPAPAPATPAPATATPAPATPAPSTNVSMPDLIGQIQTILNTKFGGQLIPDKKWGPKTQAAFENALKIIGSQAAPATPATPAPSTPAPAAAAPTTQFKAPTIPDFKGYTPSTPKL